LGVFGIVVAGGILVSIALKVTAPIGTNVGDLPVVQAVRADRSSPVAENELADVTVIIFTDYQCPVCRLAHPEMRRAIAGDGRVRIVYKDWPVFGVRSERAARVAIASNYQGIYPLVHDTLMSSGRVDEPSLKKAVEQSGGSWARLQVDLTRPAIDQQLANNRLQAFGLGLRGTPGYLIGPILIRGGARSAQFSKAIAVARKNLKRPK